MSSRFHSKYHRHNHHTVKIDDPRYPDASHDPIASPESPFLGPFVLYGTLSGFSLPPENVLENFDLTVAPPAAVFIAPSASVIAIQAEGSIQASGNITAGGTISAADISFTGEVLTTYQTPITATGEFLVINVNGLNRAIRLWQYDEDTV